MKALFISAVTHIPSMWNTYRFINASFKRQGSLTACLSIPELFLPSLGQPLPQRINHDVRAFGQLSAKSVEADDSSLFDRFWKIGDFISADLYNEISDHCYTDKLNNLICLREDNIPLIDFVYHDMALTFKIHNFNKITLSQEAVLRSHFIALLLGSRIIRSVLDEDQYGLALSFETYAIHSYLRLVCTQRRLSHRIFTNPSHKGVDFEKIEFSDVMPQNVRRRRCHIWSDANIKIPSYVDMDIISESIEDLRVRLFGSSPHVYSPPQNNHSDLKNFIGSSLGDPSQPIISIFTSSLDERIASGWLVPTMGEVLPSKDLAFSTQIDWLIALNEYASKANQVNFIVRLHPRLGRDKRGLGQSQYLHEIIDALHHGPLKILAPNFAICMPESGISSYSLMLESQLVLNGWSTVGLEAARLGLPVINAFGNNGSSCYWPEDLFPVRRSQKAYFQKIDRCIDVIMRNGFIPLDFGKLIKSHYFYSFMYCRDVVSMATSGTQEMPNDLDLIDACINPSCKSYSTINKMLNKPQGPLAHPCETVRLIKRVVREFMQASFGDDSIERVEPVSLLRLQQLC